MALLFPISSSTFGDSRETAGSPALRKYVLAQFQSDAGLDWVAKLRARLGRDELKYRDYQPEQRRIRSSAPELYRAVEAGISQATVIVIDPEPTAYLAENYLIQEQAEPGKDFTTRDIIDICAISILAGTPLAYLPEKLWIRSEGQVIFPSVNLSGFAPDELLSKVGGLGGAKVLAARAHAMFDVENKHTIEHVTSDFIVSPLRNLVFKEILSTERVFDTEHNPSVEVLNEAADVIATSMQKSPWFKNMRPSDHPLVKEASSRDVDMIQTADMAAGWAGDILELQGVRSLASTFRRVIVNGHLLD
jgi:hypothetical protein